MPFLASVIILDVIGNRPSAGSAGRIFFATDTGVEYYDDGATWQAITVDAGQLTSGTLAAGRLPNPSASTLGGVESIAAVSHQFLTAISTSGVPAQAQPTEADLSLSNISTNNVSITKHGFVPILPNDASQFLNGVGGFATPAGTSVVPSFADNETPSGSVNGSNTAFVLGNTPSPAASLQVFLNGLMQIVSTDYTLSTATVTFTNAPSTGELVRAFYRY